MNNLLPKFKVTTEVKIKKKLIHTLQLTEDQKTNMLWGDLTETTYL